MNNINPELTTNGLTAYCPQCDAKSNFTTKDKNHRGNQLSNFSCSILREEELAQFESHISQVDIDIAKVRQDSIRASYQSCECLGCERGAMFKKYRFSTLSNPNNQTTFVAEFYPTTVQRYPLPRATPESLKFEFREAEKCLASNCNRAACAMLRSTLEKALKLNGYEDLNETGYDSMGLKNKITKASKDGVIHVARIKRAETDIKVLGDEVVHRDWREISTDEAMMVLTYTSQIIQDLYQDRDTVEGLLKEKGRIS